MFNVNRKVSRDLPSVPVEEVASPQETPISGDAEANLIDPNIRIGGGTYSFDAHIDHVQIHAIQYVLY